jgi:hypothetical protein
MRERKKAKIMLRKKSIGKFKIVNEGLTQYCGILRTAHSYPYFS